MNNKQFIILGLRRSGTSILRTLITKSPTVKNILFEPHEIFHSVQLLKIGRYKKSKYHQRIINQFLSTPKLTGAKLVVNPGVDALDWIWLDSALKEPTFIFIVRNPNSNFASYKKADAKVRRGVIARDAYMSLYNQITDGFKRFAKQNPKRSIIINYDQMLIDVDKELSRAWEILNAKPPMSLKNLIKKPSH